MANFESSFNLLRKNYEFEISAAEILLQVLFDKKIHFLWVCLRMKFGSGNFHDAERNSEMEVAFFDSNGDHQASEKQEIDVLKMIKMTNER